MSHVFLSYKREDEARVVPIAYCLRRAGLSVWLDLETPGGTSWRRTIQEKLEAAGCVLVVWSEASVSAAADSVHDEAWRGKQRGVLLPVRIDPVEPPLGFGEIQALDLEGWKGFAKDPRFQDVVAAAKAILAGGSRPRPKAPGRRKRIAALSATSITVIAAILGFVADVAGLQAAFCKVPGVRAGCAAFGLGGVPTQAETDLWESRSAGDCETLRKYLLDFPNGAYAEKARSLLHAVPPETRESWTPEERRLPLTVRQGLDPLPDEDAAREDALARGVADAQLACGAYEAGEYRLLTAAPEAQTWNCTPRGTGFVCGFDGQAICQVEARRVDRVEVCP